MSSSMLRLPAVKLKTGLSRSAIYRFIQDGSFPVPRRISTRAVGWIEDEVEAWIEARPNTKRHLSKQKR